jgi:hypothetical protein
MLTTVEEVTFGTLFDQAITENTLPPNLKKLILGICFTKNLTSLPNTLEYLQISHRFNNNLVLPDSLKVLSLGDSFERDLILPPNLEELYLGYHYNKPLSLPTTIKKLRLGKVYNQKLKLSEGIEELWVSSKLKFNPPKSLKHIHLIH